MGAASAAYPAMHAATAASSNRTFISDSVATHGPIDAASRSGQWGPTARPAISGFRTVYATDCNNIAGVPFMDRLDAVTVFVAVAEQESFAAAARKLSRTPAAVTRAVAEQEASLSKRLLNRTTRSVA